MRTRVTALTTAMLLLASVITVAQLTAAPALSASAATTKTFQESDAAIAYSGSWRKMSSGSDSAGASNYLNSTGSAKLTFTGTKVVWVSRTSATSGIADVLIDGKKVATVDRYTPSNGWQVPVFTSGTLSAGNHTIEIVRTGAKNAKSGGSNLLIDAIVVTDAGTSSTTSSTTTSSTTTTAAATVVAAPTTTTTATTTSTVGSLKAQANGWGVALGWSLPTGTAKTVIKRSTNGGAQVVAATLSGRTAFLDVSVKPGASEAYTTTYLNSSGKALKVEGPVKVTAQSVSTYTPYRYSNCPSATKNVSTSSALASALASATAGTVIRLAPGNYTGSFKVGGSGTATKPIWICGPSTAVLTNGTPQSGKALTIDSKHDIVVAGITLRNNFKGLSVINSQRITATDMLIERVGYEAVHFRNQTSDSEIKYSTIRYTGMKVAKYGEGVYVGTSDSNFCLYNNCKVDRTVRISVFKNTISNTGAQAVEIKGGASDGVVAGNTINGGGEAWVLIKGNNWLVADNGGATSSEFGYGTNGSLAGWGMDNIFVRNNAKSTAKVGTWIHKPNNVDLRNRVSCLNTATSTVGGMTNVTCEK